VNTEQHQAASWISICWTAMKKEKSLDEMRRSTATTHGKEHEVGIKTQEAQTLAKEAPDPRRFATAIERMSWPRYYDDYTVN